MPRIPKKIQMERRRNLIEVAKRLFINNGYDSTTVDDIIKELNFSKVTFYYHFKSKIDVLVAIAEDVIAAMVAEVERIADAQDIDPVQKLSTCFNVIYDTFTDHKNLWVFTCQEDNIPLYFRLQDVTFKTCCPPMAKILREGMDAKLFNRLPPMETAEAMIHLQDFFVRKSSLATNAEQSERARITIDGLLSYGLGKSFFTKPINDSEP